MRREGALRAVSCWDRKAGSGGGAGDCCRCEKEERAKEIGLTIRTFLGDYMYEASEALCVFVTARGFLIRVPDCLFRSKQAPALVKVPIGPGRVLKGKQDRWKRMGDEPGSSLTELC